MAVKENGEYPTLQDMDPTKGQTVLYEKMAIILASGFAGAAVGALLGSRTTKDTG